MRERPILFSAPMVRAILDGTKTQTRRVVKPQPVTRGRVDEDCVVTIGKQTHSGPTRYMLDRLTEFGCPYGQPGDRLWVKETHAIRSTGQVVYRADTTDFDPRAADVVGGRWRPSIHMPRRASRITLTITDVRVERLQEISEVDAEAEGVAFMREHTDIDETLTAVQLYAALWDSINGEGAWSSNPWVWVVTFTRASES